LQWQHSAQVHAALRTFCWARERESVGLPSWPLILRPSTSCLTRCTLRSNGFSMVTCGRRSSLRPDALALAAFFLLSLRGLGCQNSVHGGQSERLAPIKDRRSRLPTYLGAPTTPAALSVSRSRLSAEPPEPLPPDGVAGAMAGRVVGRVDGSIGSLLHAPRSVKAHPPVAGLRLRRFTGGKRPGAPLACAG